MEKQNFTFTGRLSEIKPIKTGETTKGEWAAVDFEVTEDSAEYPQVALFSMFKSGEYLKFAKDFAAMYAIGDILTVHFNFDKNTYNKKDGSGQGVFYKCSAWKVEKPGESKPSFEVIQQDDDDGTTLPF